MFNSITRHKWWIWEMFGTLSTWKKRHRFTQKGVGQNSLDFYGRVLQKVCSHDSDLQDKQPSEGLICRRK